MVEPLYNPTSNAGSIFPTYIVFHGRNTREFEINLYEEIYSKRCSLNILSSHTSAWKGVVSPRWFQSWLHIWIIWGVLKTPDAKLPLRQLEQRHDGGWWAGIRTFKAPRWVQYAGWVCVRMRTHTHKVCWFKKVCWVIHWDNCWRVTAEARQSLGHTEWDWRDLMATERKGIHCLANSSFCDDHHLLALGLVQLFQPFWPWSGGEKMIMEGSEWGGESGFDGLLVFKGRDLVFKCQ